MPMALLPTRDDLAAELKVFIPKVGRWKNDNACGICGCGFSVLRGRHHCRYCGGSVCGKHSRNRAVVPSSMSTEKQRVCDVCYPKCQYGIPLQRRRGVTSAEGGHSANLSRSDSTDSNGSVFRAERSRAQTSFLSSDSMDSQRSDNARPWDAAQQWRDQQAARERKASSETSRRRRGISEPPERHMKKVATPVKQKAPPSPPAPLSPMTRQSISHNVFHMSPRKPKQKQFDSYHHNGKKGTSKTLSIRKHSSPPPPPTTRIELEDHRELDATFTDSMFMSSFRNTKEEDDIAMQYLQSFVKGETVTVQETNHVTVSHSNAGPMLGMATVVEMMPESPKELHISSSVSPPQSEAFGASSRPQNRFSISSEYTVSYSDSEEAGHEMSPRADWEEDESDEDIVASHPGSPVAALAIEANHRRSKPMKRQPAPATPPATPPSTPPLTPKQSNVKVSTGVTFAVDTKPSEPEISDEGLKLMREIMDLEQQIQEYQDELPKLIDEWKRVEHMASLLRADALDSRDKVKQYQKARAVVSHAIRVGSRHLANKEFEAAALVLSRAAGIERTNPKVWYLLAESRLKLGQLSDAEEACRISIELQHSAVGVALLGRVLHALGRHDDAIRCYLTALGRK